MDQSMSGLRLLACDQKARHVFNAMRVRSKCSGCCAFEVGTDLVEMTEPESEDAVKICCM